MFAVQRAADGLVPLVESLCLVEFCHRRPPSHGPTPPELSLAAPAQNCVVSVPRGPGCQGHHSKMPQVGCCKQQQLFPPGLGGQQAETTVPSVWIHGRGVLLCPHTPAASSCSRIGLGPQPKGPTLTCWLLRGSASPYIIVTHLGTNSLTLTHKFGGGVTIQSIASALTFNGQMHCSLWPCAGCFLSWESIPQ